ncbi:hypothetical protein F8M41_018074 [Gigaspora margarita]|uniref:CCHC-type domain-containing protein n=1 Tax=Gigaspora margarita TaxID=4874 RepID=A0A8H4AM78_GIGMA|nr:hypothetical protein F8M41_018074 [Gigaspora margarita]
MEIELQQQGNQGKVKRRKIHESNEDNDGSKNLPTTSLNEALKTQESDNDGSENLPTTSLNEALKTQESGSKQCGICRQRGHNARTCPDRDVDKL